MDEDERTAREAAARLNGLHVDGQKIIAQALYDATDQMTRLTKNLNTKGQKIAALEHHGLYIGIGDAFMDRVAPKAASMTEELMERHRQAGSNFPEREAQMLTDIWLSKVFIEIGKGIANHKLITRTDKYCYLSTSKVHLYTLQVKENRWQTS